MIIIDRERNNADNKRIRKKKEFSGCGELAILYVLSVRGLYWGFAFKALYW
jgi:hypothetical protein